LTRSRGRAISFTYRPRLNASPSLASLVQTTQHIASPRNLRQTTLTAVTRVVDDGHRSILGNRAKLSLGEHYEDSTQYCFVIAAATSLVHAQQGQCGLSPSEINSLKGVNAGAGTSGVSGIQTRTLKGDATKSGTYTIQLTIQRMSEYRLILTLMTAWPPSSLEHGTSVTARGLTRQS